MSVGSKCDWDWLYLNIASPVEPLTAVQSSNLARGRVLSFFETCSTFGQSLCAPERSWGKGGHESHNQQWIFYGPALGYLASPDVTVCKFIRDNDTHSEEMSPLPQLSHPDCLYITGAEGGRIFRHCLEHWQRSLHCSSSRPQPPGIADPWHRAGAPALTESCASHCSHRFPSILMNKYLLFCCKPLDPFLGNEWLFY